MQFVIEGILVGLMLSALLGPIFIALTQTAIEKGARAGLAVCVGIWVSDFLIISLCYAFVQIISKTVQSENFMLWMGILGGVILMAFGIIAFTKKINFEKNTTKHSLKNYAQFWIKGFIVNTVNPFTFIFWIGAISSYLIGKQSNSSQALLFLGSIMITIMLTDFTKVLLAKLIRNRLNEKYISWITKGAGLGLFVFGIILIVQSI